MIRRPPRSTLSSSSAASDVYKRQSQNIEMRTAQHLGVKSGGAQWTKTHKPISVLEVRLCQTKEEATIMEVMLTAVHQAQVGYQCCRGARWNMAAPMKKPPPYFENCSEGPEEVDIPRELPPMYATLCEENNITEAPPVPAPCFINSKDPTGQYRQLASLLPA